MFHFWPSSRWFGIQTASQIKLKRLVFGWKNLSKNGMSISPNQTKSFGLRTDAKIRTKLFGLLTIGPKNIQKLNETFGFLTLSFLRVRFLCILKPERSKSELAETKCSFFPGFWTFRFWHSIVIKIISALSGRKRWRWVLEWRRIFFGFLRWWRLEKWQFRTQKQQQRTG